MKYRLIRMQIEQAQELFERGELEEGDYLKILAKLEIEFKKVETENEDFGQFLLDILDNP